MFDPQICQKFQNQKLNCCKICTSSIFFSPQNLTQKFQHQMVYIWQKFSLQFCSKFLEQNSELECFTLLSLLTNINKNFSKWCLQNLTQEKALGETSNLSTLRTTGSDIFSKYWPVSEAKIGQPIGTNFCAKLNTRNLHPNPWIFGAISWCQIWHTLVPNGGKFSIKFWTILTLIFDTKI